MQIAGTSNNSRMFLYYIVSRDGVTRWRHHMLQYIYIGTYMYNIMYIPNKRLPG